MNGYKLKYFLHFTVIKWSRLFWISLTTACRWSKHLHYVYAASLEKDDGYSEVVSVVRSKNYNKPMSQGNYAHVRHHYYIYGQNSFGVSLLLSSERVVQNVTEKVPLHKKLICYLPGKLDVCMWVNHGWGRNTCIQCFILWCWGQLCTSALDTGKEDKTWPHLIFGFPRWHPSNQSE